MKLNSNYIVILMFISLMISCSGSDDNLELLNNPVILDEVDLTDKFIRSTDSQGSNFQSVEILDENNLLIYETNPFSTSSIYKYNLLDESLVKCDEDIWSDLRYTTIELMNDEIVFISRSEEIISIDLMNLQTNYKIPIQAANNTYIKINDHLYYKMYDLDNIDLVEFDLRSMNTEVLYQVNRGIQENLTNPGIEWDVYQLDEQSNGFITFDLSINEEIKLVNYNITNDVEIWNVELVEFDDNSIDAPYKILVQEGKVIVFSENYMSCRKLSTGDIIWSKNREEIERYYPIEIFGDKIVTIGKDEVKTYDIENGNLIWRLLNHPKGASWYSPSVRLSRFENHLFINQIPVVLETGELIWNSPFLEQQDELMRNFNQPDVDIENEIIYYMIDDIMYKLELPSIE